MIELGMTQVLEVVRMKEFGVYLAEEGSKEAAGSEASVLLPKRQVPEGTKLGDKIEVFIYKDSEDRIIATTTVPKLQVSQVAVLEVKEVGKIGAFLDMGLEKDLLLPFKEQTHPLRVGEQCLVALYIDKSKRLAATMKVYAYLSSESPYEKESKVTGTVYEMNESFGAFVAVDNLYNGLIPKKELFVDLREGQIVEARVTKVREDGKLDLSVREKACIQMNADAELVMKVLDEFEGVLPFTDKADPEIIKREFNLSKNAFKRAVGQLLKNGKVKITEKTIEKL